MRRLVHLSITLLIFSVVLLTSSGCTEKQPDSLARDGWVTDYANIFPLSDKARIAGTLAAFEKDTCHQLYVLIVPSLGGEKMVDFSQRIATAWDIGLQGFGNGILLTIAMQEGSMRLETASAFDWFVEQGVSEKVLQEVMVPYFKDERYVEGIEQGLTEIMKNARLKVVPEDHRPEVCRK